MAAWELVPSLAALRSQFNAIAPNRDKATDGSIGDTAHANGGNSDHLPDEQYAALRGKDADARNEVHAIDVDKDLRTPGLSMEIIVQRILVRCRSGKEKRLRYIIFNKRIWRAANDWRQEKYTGSNPHDHHAHFSASYETNHENDTSSWHLEGPKESTVALTASEIDAIANAVANKMNTQVTQTDSMGGKVSGVGRGVWDSGLQFRPGEQRRPAYDGIQDMQVQLDAIQAAVNAQASDLSACKSLLLQITESPEEPGHPIVEAVRYANTNPA